MVNVFLTVTPKPDSVDEFRARMGELLDIIRSEPGCDGVVWGKVHGEERYAVLERYVDEEARQAHLSSEAMKTLAPGVFALCAERSEAVYFDDE